MAFKEKLIGILLVLIGLLPFLLKIKAVGDFFTKYTFLSYFAPGEIVYQIIIVVLGVLLLWRIKAKFERSE